jgi:hypothetical protein
VHILVQDDDESIALSTFAAEMNIDILVNYGYSISVMIHSVAADMHEEAH